MRRVLCVAVASIVVVASLFIGIGRSEASPLPRLTITGDSMGVFGNHSYCRGVLRVGLDTSPSKRGVVRLTLTSSGFVGNGASWVRNPVCKLLIGTSYVSGIGYGVTNFFPAEFGPKRGQKVVRDIRTGSGVVQLAVGTFARNNPVRVFQSSPNQHFLLVP